MQIFINSEDSLIIYFGQDISPQVSRQVQAAVTLVENNLKHLVIDLIPSYGSLLIQFKADKVSYRTMIRLLKGLLGDAAGKTNAPPGETLTLPVYYDISVGPDLRRIARHNQITLEDVIACHTARQYQVYAIGFAPGFAYLGTVDKTIAMPRHPSPRTQVARGSVAIAEQQTAVYPTDSPGGWNIIGRCPTPLFTPNKKPMMPLAVGDTVQFEAIDRQTFLSLGGEL